MKILLCLPLIAVSCFATKPIDPKAWDEVKLPSISLPTEIRKITAWKNKAGCFVTVQSVDGSGDPQSAIDFAAGCIDGVAKSGFYPQRISSFSGSQFPNVAVYGTMLVDGMEIESIICIVFGRSYTHTVNIIRPSTPLVLLKEFDLEDTPENKVAERLSHFSEIVERDFLTKWRKAAMDHKAGLKAK